MKKLSIAALLTLTLFISPLFAMKTTDTPERQTAGIFYARPVLTNVTYKVADNETLQFDISYPEGAAPKEGWPLIIYLHGGGWTGGERHGGFGFNNNEIHFYNREGIAIATVSYRFARGGENPRTIKDCVVDVKDAARFMVKNSKTLGINPKKMGIYGHSAGGHLSMMAALAPDNLFIGDPSLKNVKASFACAVPQSGPTSFIDADADDVGMFTQNPDLMTMRLGGTPEETTTVRKLISPTEYLSKNSPPMLVVQGAKDNIVSVKAALFLKEKADAVGAPVELLIAETGGHSVENADHNQIAKQRRAFFLKPLK
jgi:acetyl esterase/lipase